MMDRAVSQEPGVSVRVVEEPSVPRAATAGDDELVDYGWECLRRGAWRQARSMFEAELRGDATPGGFEGLAWSCFWLVDVDALFQARAEAFRLFHERRDPYGAARAAMWIGSEHVEFKGSISVANGWFRRARRLLATADPSPEHGWLALPEGEGAVGCLEAHPVCCTGALNRISSMIDGSWQGSGGGWATWFRALGDPSRIVILNLLATADRAVTVGEIVDELGLASRRFIIT